MKRATCEVCLRAQSACICGFIARVQARAALLVLQHPLEVGNAKNSARLLHLCVAGSVLAVGETFEAGELAACCMPMGACRSCCIRRRLAT